MKRYVIVGGGVAGSSAAERIRKKDPKGKISLFTAENVPYYYRVRLPDVLSGEATIDRITLHPAKWFTDRGIDLHLGKKIVEADSEARLVRDEDGGTAEWDALLLATGAHSFIPPVPGADKPGVFSLRTWKDTQAISDWAGTASRAVLIGGGLLGLEAAHGLIQRGIAVKVIESAERLLPRQTCPPSSRKLQEILEHMGYSFYLGAQVEALIGEEKVEGAVLKDGRTLDCDLVIFSAGIRPNLELAKALGLDINKGLVVDDFLQTSRPGIWAAGDLVEHQGRMYGIWAAAMDQGRIAGENMADGRKVYQGTLMTNTLKVAGVEFTAAGNIDPEFQMEDIVIEGDNSFRKIVLDHGRMIGLVFLGTHEGLKQCELALERHEDLTPLKDAIQNEKDGFDFSKLDRG